MLYTRSPLATVASPDGSYIGVFMSAGNKESDPGFGDIWELPIRNGVPCSWTNHGQPVGTPPETTPVSASLPSGYISVFVFKYQNDGTHVYELHQTGQNSCQNNSIWQWIDHGTPPTLQNTFDSLPSVVSTPTKYIGVFGVGPNGDLAELSSKDGQSWVWQNHGRPSAATHILVDVSTVVSPDGHYIGAFCTEGAQEQVWELPIQDGIPLSWINHGTPANPIHGSLSPVFLPTGFVSVFLKAYDGHLYELSQWGNAATDWRWNDHGNPWGGSQTCVVPQAITSPDNRYTGVFVIDLAKQIWELPFRNGWQSWINHGYPAAGAICSMLSPVVTSQGYLGFFAIGSDYHLYEMHQLGNDWGESGEGWSGWIDRGTPG